MDLFVQSLSALLEVIAIKDFTLNVYVFILSAISISFDVFEKSILVLVQFPRKIVVIHWPDARDITRISVGPHGTNSCFGLTPTFGLHLFSLQPNFKVFILVPTT